MNAIVELFGRSLHVHRSGTEWEQIVKSQQCPFIDKTCYKVRKSDPTVSIGTCTVLHGRSAQPIAICPARLLAKDKIFTDCIHLLTVHEPGNELHVVPEVSVPGGSVDYFLVSARRGKVHDFAGIELQTLDTTGTVWPERQRLLAALNVSRNDDDLLTRKPFGMNWKMTAKTILMQLHHKIATFEHFNKHLALVTQDRLLQYMEKEFSFAHIKRSALMGDPMQFHSYTIELREGEYQLDLSSRWSTDTGGVAACLGLHAESRLGLAEIVGMLESRIGSNTIFTPFAGSR